MINLAYCSIFDKWDLVLASGTSSLITTCIEFWTERSHIGGWVLAVGWSGQDLGKIGLTENAQSDTFKAPCLVALNMYLTWHLLFF